MKQDLQGQGIGKKLLKQIEIIARNHGIKRLELEVEADNPGAIRLYSSMGFTYEGAKRGFVKRPEESYYVDEWVMGKWLD